MRNRIDILVEEMKKDAEEKGLSLEETVNYINSYFLEDKDIDYDGWSFLEAYIDDNENIAIKRFLKEY